MYNLESTKNIRLGEVLINEGYLTEKQLEEALAHQKQSTGKRLGDILVELNFVTEDQKHIALSKRTGIPLVSIDSYAVNINAVSKIPRTISDKYKVIAIDITDGKLLVAVNDPLNFFAIEEVRQAAMMPITLCMEKTVFIEKAINYYYSELSTRKAVSEVNSSAGTVAAVEELISSAAADDAPVVKLLNSLLVKGYNINASDIHIEPFAENVSVRIRVDGTIIDYTQLPLSIHPSLIARIKVLGDLDIAEKRIPQDGHFKVNTEGTDLNIRVSLVPTVYGEKAVLRFLTSNSSIDNDNTFGMTPENYDKMIKALNSPHGIIYITGPTGSGKTTTLYMMLNYLAAKQVNIATIEDPVERNVTRVNQIQVNNTSGLTFEVGLRALLRQDPDIIMLGETRDAETATISVRAAITGHLVLSTLHTNDAISSIVRLGDMGVADYLISSSLISVVAQRLVRKICPECGYSYEASETDKALLGRDDVSKLYAGKGCNYCNGTGYKGRIAIHEILTVDKTIRNMITNNATGDEIFEYSKKAHGMTTLRDMATDLVIKGVISIDELVKTAYYDD